MGEAYKINLVYTSNPGPGFTAVYIVQCIFSLLCKLRLRVQYLVDMLVFRRCGLFGAKEEEKWCGKRTGARNPSFDSCTL